MTNKIVNAIELNVTNNIYAHCIIQIKTIFSYASKYLNVDAGNGASQLPCGTWAQYQVQPHPVLDLLMPRVMLLYFHNEIIYVFNISKFYFNYFTILFHFSYVCRGCILFNFV